MSDNKEPLLTGNTNLSSNSIERRKNYGAIRIEEPDSGRGSASSSNSILTSPPTSVITTTSDENQRSTLSFFSKIGFGLGHIYNDLCAGVWFSYTLLFMQAVLLLPAPEAGALVMVGQVCDALATPLIGFLADRFGTKRQWHIFGTILVFLTFPMIFSMCPWCDEIEFWWPIIYFSFFIILFQCAWATVQITHLAMIPEMSMTQKDRTDLTATRYSASVFSNVIVYMITWAMLKNRKASDSNNGNDDVIGPLDAFRFRDISLILTLIGLTMSVLFHFSLSVSGYERRRLLTTANYKEPILEDMRKSSVLSEDKSIPGRSRKLSTNTDDDDEQNSVDGNTDNNSDNTLSDEANTITTIEIPPIPNSETLQTINYDNFFKSPLLYQNAFLYVFARLFMTTSLIYMPLWLDERSWSSNVDSITDVVPTNFTQVVTPYTDTLTLLQDKTTAQVEHLATVPLVSFLAAFVSSMLLKWSSFWVGHQLAYLCGSAISISGCIWTALAVSKSFTTETLYFIAILFGSGSSITMISSLCITADMIGSQTAKGGFIYSAVTFCDKLITGIVIVVIETLKCKNRSQCPEYYKSILAYGCGISAACGILILISLQFTKKRNNVEGVLVRRVLN